MDQTIDYERSVWLPVWGVVVPVMPLPDLIEYKAALGRPVDLVDVTELLSGPRGTGEEAGWLDRSAASSPGPDS